MPSTKPLMPYTTRNWAVAYHHSFCRWAVNVLHRRSGKTTADLAQLHRAATDDGWERRRLTWLALKGGFSITAPQMVDLLRGRQYGFVLPTRTHAKTVAWKPLKYFAESVRGHVINESELKITYPGGHTIQLFGGDEPDKLRGPHFSGLVLDEYGLHKPNTFSEVLSKNLADHLGWCTFSGTIKGKNQLYKTWLAAQGDPDWFTIWQDIDVSLATEDDAATVMLREAMKDDRKLIAKGLMTQEEYDQEWYLSTEAALKGAYYATQIAQLRRDKRVRPIPYDPALPVHDVWDLGAGPNMAVGLFQRVAREVRMIEYLEGIESEGLPQMIATLQRKPYVYGKHLAPHDIAATSIATGKTYKQTAKDLGWEFTPVPNISVADGINAVRLLFARLWIDDSPERHCDDFLELLGHYRRPWLEHQGIFGDHPIHDFSSHVADMIRYAAVGEDLMISEKVKPKRQVGVGPQRDPGSAGLGWMGG